MKQLIQSFVLLVLGSAVPAAAHEGPVRSDLHVLLHLGYAATLVLVLAFCVVLLHAHYHRSGG